MRTCGALTKYSFGVSVLPARQRLGPTPANVFSAVAPTNMTLDSGTMRSVVRAAWLTDDSLSVEHDERLLVTLSVVRVGPARPRRR